MLTVRRAQPEDAIAILALQKFAFQTMAVRTQRPRFPPVAEELDDLVRDFSASFIAKALWFDELIGSARGTVSGEYCDIRRMSVHPHYHGRGIGSALLAFVEAGAPGVRIFRLTTSTLNAEAIRLYQRNGYIIKGTQAESESGPIVLMEKQRVSAA